MDLPEKYTSKGQKPVANKILPWDTITQLFFTPDIPETAQANPFEHTLVNHQEPPKPVPPKVDPPKPAPPKPAPPKPAPPKPTTPTPPPVPPKPDQIISIKYRGFYVDLNGDTQVFLTVSNSIDKSSQSVAYKIGSVILDKITIDSVSDNSAVFSANSQKTTIDWNEKHDFIFKQN